MKVNSTVQHGCAEPTHINLSGIMLGKATELHLPKCRWGRLKVHAKECQKHSSERNPSGKQSWRNGKRAIMGVPGFSCQEALSSNIVFWVSCLLILGKPFCALKHRLQSRSFSEHGWLGSPGLYGDTGVLHRHGEPFLWPCRQRSRLASVVSWRW